MYLTREQIANCNVLAERYHTNRSEVIRVALVTGLPLAWKELRRIQRVRASRAATVSEPGRRPVSSEANASPADLSDELRQYAETVLVLDPQRPEAELRLLLTTQAKVLQVPADELEDVVDEVITMLPSAAEEDAESEDGVRRSEPPA